MKTLLLLTLTPFIIAQPKSIAYTGTECIASTTPHCGGFAAIALPIAQSDTFSWTKIFQGSPSKAGLPASVTTTGLAKRLWTLPLGNVKLNVMGLGAVGASQTATATTAAFNAGGGVDVSGLSKRWPWMRAWVGGLQEKAGSSQTRVTLGIGGSW